MKNPFAPGDTKSYLTKVNNEKLARFDAGLVHRLYSTFALGKDAEWCCRLFVLEMLEEGEEGVGSYLSVEHLSPALEGATVEFVAELVEVRGNEIICRYEARVRDRLVARGKQIQKIVIQKKFEEYIDGLKKKEGNG